MKKALITLLLIMIGIGANGQNGYESNATEHLKFNGVAMYGSVKKFAQQQETLGLKIDKEYLKKNATYRLHGRVGNFENCKVYLDHTKKDKWVFGVQVILPDSENWEDLYGNYEKIRNWMTNKYGKPTKEVEDFMTEQQPQNNDEKYRAIKDKKCICGVMYELDYGMIIVYLDNPEDEAGVTHCHATMYFIDTLNYDIFSEEAQLDL